jgi:hypothetical protein
VQASTLVMRFALGVGVGVGVGLGEEVDEVLDDPHALTRRPAAIATVAADRMRSLPAKLTFRVSQGTDGLSSGSSRMALRR